jgi:hypothetical protein
MALKRLTNYELSGVLSELCGPLRPRIAAHAPIAWQLTNLDTALAIFTRRWLAEADPELSGLSKRGGQLDFIHDLIIRFLISVLDSLALHAEIRAPGTGQAWLDLSKQLAPEGLMHTLKSWFEEGAHADTTGAWLDGQPAVRATLQAVVLPGGDTLLAVIEHWIAVGRELLAVERRRQDRLRELGEQKQPNELPRARSLAIQAIDGLRRYFAQDSAAPADLRAALLDRVNDLEARADRLRRKAPDPQADPQQPEEVESEPA